LVGAKELYFKLGRLHEGDWGLGGIKDWGEIHVDRVFISLTTAFLVGGGRLKSLARSFLIPGQDRHIDFGTYILQWKETLM